jgi:hypothetical protein
MAAANAALAAAHAKTADLEKLRAHVAAVRAHWGALWTEALWLGHARERLRAHGAKQRVLDGFAARLTLQLDVDPSTLTRAQRRELRSDPSGVLVAYGAAHFAPSGRGELPVPTTTAFKRVKRAFPHTDAVDEYATSKMCPTCHGKLAKVGTVEGGSWHEVRGLRMCNNACGRCANRDKAAARNILAAGLAVRRGQGRPAYLARGDSAPNAGQLPRVTLAPHQILPQTQQAVAAAAAVPQAAPFPPLQ